MRRILSHFWEDSTKVVPLYSPDSKTSDSWTLNSIMTECTDLSDKYSFKDSNGLPACLTEYSDRFSAEMCKGLPPHRSFDIQINLKPGSTPPWGRLITLSDADNTLLKQYINEELEKGYIVTSESPCSSPIFFVAKSDGTKRPCIDYRALNQIAIKNRYPIPSAEALTDCLSGSKIFSKIDLRAAFNQIRVKEGHEWLTAFRTPFGLYEYKVMPFGLCNAP